MPQPQTLMSIETLKQEFGSLRMLIGKYWNNQLTNEQERVLEDRIPVETLIGYKPIC